eukprot:COSAG02_NODE_922_length_15907_cov_4.423303_2_plen_95_part_00
MFSRRVGRPVALATSLPSPLSTASIRWSRSTKEHVDHKKLVIDALERQLAELRKDCVGVKLHVVEKPDQPITSDENAEDEGDSDLELEDEQQLA